MFLEVRVQCNLVCSTRVYEDGASIFKIRELRAFLREAKRELFRFFIRFLAETSSPWWTKRRRRRRGFHA